MLCSVHTYQPSPPWGCPEMPQFAHVARMRNSAGQPGIRPGADAGRFTAQTRKGTPAARRELQSRPADGAIHNAADAGPRSSLRRPRTGNAPTGADLSLRLCDPRWPRSTHQISQEKINIAKVVRVDVPNHTFHQIDGVSHVHRPIVRVSPISLHLQLRAQLHSREAASRAFRL